MMKFIYKAILAVTNSRSKIADSIRDDTDKWSFETHYAINGDIKVWIANATYGMHVEVGQVQYNPSRAERALIWNEVKKIREKEKLAAERKIRRLLSVALEKL